MDERMKTVIVVVIIAAVFIIAVSCVIISFLFQRAE